MKHWTAALITAVIFTGCHIDHWALSREVFDESDTTVFLEHRIEDDKVVEQAYDHPANLDTGKTEAILKGLVYQGCDNVFADTEALPVFDPKSLVRLAPALAGALRTAGPEERVRFISSNMGGGWIFPAKRKTEGVAFVKPRNRLNIAFCHINRELEMDELTFKRAPRRSSDPLKAVSSETPLKPTTWYTHRSIENSDRPHPTWIVVNLDEVRFKAVETEQEEPATGQPEPVPEKKKAAVPDEKPEPQKKPQHGMDHDPIKDKLRRLKSYFDEGLIDEEEYRARIKEVLDEMGTI